MDTAIVLTEALARQRAGELAAAEALYRQVLADAPENADALHLLGMIEHQRGNSSAAIDLIGRAIERQPDYVQARGNLASVLVAARRYEEAEPHLRAAIARRPSGGRLHQALGNLLHKLGRLDESIASYREAVTLQPDHPGLRNSLGNVLADRGHLPEAVTSYRAALSLRPEYSLALVNLGAALNDMGQTDAALAAFRRAHEIEPDNPNAAHMAAALGGEASAAPPEGYVRGFFDAYAPKFEQRLVGELGYRVPEMLRHAIDAVRPPGRFRSAIDLGCGTGLVAAAFRDRVDSMTGVDLAPAMVAEAGRKGLYASLEVGDIVTALVNAAGRRSKFDLILAADVFIYVGALEAVFRAAAAVLEPSGLFGFSIEHLDGDGFRLQPSGRYAHSPEYVMQWAQESGLAPISQTPVALRMEQGEPLAGAVIVLGPASPT